MAVNTPGRPVLYILLALAVLAADQVTKWFVLEHLKGIPGQPFIGQWLWLTYTENRGGAFGILQTSSPLFVLVGVVVAGALLTFFKRIMLLPAPQRIAFALVLGGTFGNLLDRVRLGYVVDFLELRRDAGMGPQPVWPVFNVADSAICVGMALIAIGLMRAAPAAPEPPMPVPNGETGG